MAGAGSIWRSLRLVEDHALIFIQTIAMVPAAYLVIKRRARQKKKHEEAFLGYEADDEDNDNEGVSFGWL